MNPALAADGKIKRILVYALETCGGIAGAALVLSGIVMTTMVGDARNKVLWLLFVVVLLASGATLTLVRRLTPLRIVAGSIALVLLVSCLIAAIVLPPIR
jgi:hypothetical protein